MMDAYITFFDLARKRLAWIKPPLFAFLITRVVILFGGYFGEIIIPNSGGAQWHTAPNNVWLDIWARWDSGFYLQIVESGYSYVVGQESNVAFFPLYPLLVKLVDQLVQNPLLAGVIVSNTMLLGALLFFYKLTELELGGATASRAVYYIACFPTAFFFSAVYTESTFLFCAVGAFYFARRRLWVWAALFAMLATVSRIVGLTVWGSVGLFWLADHGWTISGILRADSWRTLGHGLRHDWRAMLPILAVPLGLLSHMRFLGQAFGDPLAFWSVQSAWQRENIGVFAIVKRDLNAIIVQNFGSGDIWWHIIFNLVALFAALVVAILIWRRLGEAYALFTLLAVLIPASSGTGSMTRYVLVLFPIFMLLAHWGHRRTIDRLVVIGFTLFLGLFMTVFVNWIFIA